MKRLLCLLLCAACACALSACSVLRPPAQPDPTVAAEFAPQTTAMPEARHGEEDQSKLIGNDPTLPPVETVPPGDAPEAEADVKVPDSVDEAEYFSIDALLSEDAPAYAEGTPAAEHAGDASIPVIDPATFQFSALTDTTLGFTFNYPTHWENLPGVFTVCFRESVEPGDFPARVAVSAKKLVHTAEGNVLASQLSSYMRTIYQMYDAATFQPGTANESDSFMGRTALSNTYLAYYGDIEVKGFIIGCAVEKTVYVFHFCASYEDYTAMEGVMRYMKNSVELVKR